MYNDENKEKVVMATKVNNGVAPQTILKKDPELNKYLLCISYTDGTETWDFITGRTELYETIKGNIEFMDLERSFLVLEDHPLTKRKSIVTFMKYAESFYEDNFDIEDYIKGDWSDNDYNDNNNIDPTFDNNDSRIDMAGFMNGDINTSPLQ